MGTPSKLPVDVVSKILLVVITVGDKLENTVQPGVGFGINRVAGEIVPSLCMSQLNAITWKFPFDVVSESLLEVIPVSRMRCSLLLRLVPVVSLARLSSPLRTCRLGVSVPCSFHFHAALIVAITPRTPCPPR